MGYCYFKICLKMFQTHPSFWHCWLLGRGGHSLAALCPMGLKLAQATARCLPRQPGHTTPELCCYQEEVRENSIPSSDFLLNTSPAPELEQPAFSNTRCCRSMPGALSASGPSPALCQGHSAISQLTHPPWLSAANTAKFKLTAEFRDSRTFVGQQFC